MTGVGTGDPRYVGTEGIAECQAFGGSIACASTVPVEGTGGSGTANSHWRETTFETELMTGFIDAGGNPLSRMTIGALKDFGYEVIQFPADDYTIFLNALRADAPAKPRVKWEEMVLPIGVMENGRIRK